jgi:hypothetical protein
LLCSVIAVQRSFCEANDIAGRTIKVFGVLSLYGPGNHVALTAGFGGCFPDRIHNPAGRFFDRVRHFFDRVLEQLPGHFARLRGIEQGDYSANYCPGQQAQAKTGNMISVHINFSFVKVTLCASLFVARDHDDQDHAY